MTIELMNELIAKEKFLILYITTETCNVCKILKPKIINLINGKYPKIKFIEIDSKITPEISAQFSVFTVPTLLIFLDGSEHYRKSRFINLHEIENIISRPYNILF